MPSCTAPRNRRRSVQLLFGQLVGAGKQRRREVEPEVSRRRKIDDELEFGRLLDRQIAGLCSVRDLDQNVHHPFRHLFETRKGEVITSKDEYFVTAPRFTTASKKYEWIDHLQGGKNGHPFKIRRSRTTSSQSVSRLKFGDWGAPEKADPGIVAAWCGTRHSVRVY
jgi:hypothetical protein